MTLRETLQPPYNFRLDTSVTCHGVYGKIVCDWHGEYGDLEYNKDGLSRCPKCGGRALKIERGGQ